MSNHLTVALSHCSAFDVASLVETLDTYEVDPLLCLFCNPGKVLMEPQSLISVIYCCYLNADRSNQSELSKFKVNNGTRF